MPPSSPATQSHGFVSQAGRGMSAVSYSRHICCVTQQTCLLYHTADMSAASHSRHVCCVTQQTCPAVSHSRHVCCVAQQTCLLRHTADMSAVSHSRHACCVTNMTRLLFHTQQTLSGTKGRILDKATNEKVPYVYIHVYVYMYIHMDICM